MKFTKLDTWCISTDGEIFINGCDTKAEAVEAIKFDYGGSGYIGRQVKVEFTKEDIFSIDVEEYLSETLFDNVGEVAETWEFTKAQRKEFVKEFGEFVIDFIDRNDLQPSCYRVEDIEQVEAGEQE